MISGLTDDEQSTLSEFASRLAATAAALRDAWLRADPGNAHAIEIAIAVLFHESHSMRRNQTLMRKVLAYGHDRHEELITNVSCVLLDLGAIDGRLQAIRNRARELFTEGASEPHREIGSHKDLEMLGLIEADAEACLIIFRETSEATVAPDAPSETRMIGHPTAREVVSALSPFGNRIPTDDELKPRRDR